MFKKYKSKLLGIISISMITAIPIVVTSCGTTTNSNTSSSEEKPTEIPNDPIVKGDETNNDNFVPTTNNGLYANLTNKLDSYFSWEFDSILYDLSKYYSMKDNDIKDLIKMWSFNKWFSTKNILNLKPMQSKLENVSITKGENSNWNISFEYIFKLVVKEENKEIPVYAKKHYSGTISSLSLNSNINFTTTPIDVRVNGYDALTGNDFSDTIKRILLFARSKNSNLSFNEIINTFFKNKNIKGTLGLWKNDVQIVKGVFVNNERTKITIDFNEFDSSSSWYNLSKDSTLEKINNIVYKKNTRNNKLELNETFVNLINNKNGSIKSFTVASQNLDSKTTKFIIYLEKDKSESFNSVKGLLELDFKNYN